MRIYELIKGDMKFQIKYGFYLIYAVFTLVYIFLLSIIPNNLIEKAAAIMIYSDPAALGLFFMGAIILFEKNQNVLSALAVSPVRAQEYIVGKVVSLGVISVLVSLAIAVFAGMDNLFQIVFLTALTSIVFTLIGIILGSKINNLNSYIFSMVAAQIIFLLPPIVNFIADIGILKWLPLSSVVLSFYDGSMFLYSAFALIIIIILLFTVAVKTTKKMFSSLGGAKI